MVDRLVSVGDDFKLPAAVMGPLNATFATKAEAAAGGGERPVWASKAHPFDVEKSLYNAAGLHSAQVAFSKAFTGAKPFHVMFVGDSNTYGSITDLPYQTNAFPGLFRTNLNRTYTSAGTGLVPTFVGTVNDGRLTYTGAWTDWRDRGFATHTARATGIDKKITFGPFTGTGFKVHYVKDSTGGDFTVAVDGGAGVVVASNATTEALATYTVTGLSDAAHTIVITAPASGNATIIAVEGTSAGIQKVTSTGYSGAQISNVTSTATPAAPLNTIFDVDAPDLLVLMMEVNDYGNMGTPIDTYKTRYRLLLDRAEAEGTTVLIVAGVPVQAPRIVVAGSPTHEEFHTSLYELADEYNLPLIDTHHRWGTWAQANALGLMADDYHINKAGHGDLSVVVAKVADPNLGPMVAAALPANAAKLDAAQTWSKNQRIGYLNHGSEQIDLGGFDNYAGNATAPTVPFVLSNNVGALWIAAKSTQEVMLRSRVRMEGTLPFTLAAVTTAQRTSVAAPAIGSMVFDSTLGKPIWYSGTGWVDATGAAA